MRVDVHFLAVELRWMDLMRQHGRKAVLCAEHIDLFPKVKHPAQGQVKEMLLPQARSRMRTAEISLSQA